MLNKLKNMSLHGILMICLLILFDASYLFAAEVTLTWSPPSTNTNGSPLNNLGGYIIYCGTESGNYSQNIDVGNVTNYTVTNLPPGITYYFSVTAYNSSGNESNFSNEDSETLLSDNNTQIDYYCDNDNDTFIDISIDGSCAGNDCAPAGCQKTPGNDCDDDNPGIHPGTSDANCDGIDTDRDGVPDDEYLSQVTQCGKGECESVGLLMCQGGKEVDTCILGKPTE